MTKEQAKTIVEKLVNRYTEQQKSYHAADYNETKTRRDFIDPFFKALGWDMDNEQDVAEPYREVIHEDKLKIQGKVKSPDYGFRLQGAKQRLFFVEAKKPSVALKTSKEAAFQIRRYGWNSKVSVSILTNFEEFIVYDCSKKPSITESASASRLKSLSFDQYLQEFDFIYDTFSREAVVKGRFDNYVKSDTAKKGTQTLDKEFVASLDKWRQYLAIDVAKSNLKLSEDELNFAVQLIIDRLIFLRFCEDRGVETYGQLKSAVSKGNAYENLHFVFKSADDKYNSGLFDFEKDQVTHDLKVTNKVIKNIVEELYYPLSQYDFKALPVEVLGNAYEQFLGKVIRINKAHHAVIEEKPEVRKAGGVYYTPQYIVDYIVENTLGQLIKDKTPKEIEKIKIVDPACGSGSFLLGAFHYLLNYHQQYYYNNPPSAKSGIITPNGTLSTAEKKKILLNNIFGVDLDSNAVEVSKLSLLLKCMEGETEASIKQQITMFHDRVLPDLDNNIKDGNSLIDTDIYDSELDFGEEKKIKPFSWKKQFPSVFNQGGFDIVIGNPPYVFGRDWKSLGIGDDIKNYLGEHYKSSPYQLDFFSIFMEKGTQLVKKDGIISFIVPNVWLTNTYSSTTRAFILKNSATLKISVPETKVFEGITVDTIIYFSKKSERKDKLFSVAKVGQSGEKLISELSFKEYEDGLKPISTSLSKIGNSLIEKIKFAGNELSALADITRGVHPYRTGGYGKSAFNKGAQIQRDVDERPYNSAKQLSGYRPFIYGKDLQRFTFVKHTEYIKYGSWLAEPREEKYFIGDRIYSRKILGKSGLVITIENGNSVTDQQVYILN